MTGSTSGGGGSAVPLGSFITLVFLWLVWGTSWPAMRMVFLELPVWQFRALACALAGLVLLSMGRAQSPERWRVPRRMWGRLILAAFFNMTCWHILVSFGLQILGAGHAAIVCYTLPVWTALFAGIFLGERITWQVFLALILGMAGVAILFVSGLGKIDGAALGFALVLTSAMTWAIGTLIVKNVVWPTSMTALAGWQLLIGLVPMAVMAALTEDFVLHKASTDALLAGLYVVLIGMIAGYALWFRVVDIMPATIASIGALMIPIVGVLSAALVLGEPVGWREFVAMALVLSAVALVLFFRPKAA